MKVGTAPISEENGLFIHPFEDLSEATSYGERSLVGTKCTHCGQEMIGRRYACSQCAGDAVVAIELPESGEIYSFTDVHVGGRDGPVTYAYVDLSNGVRTLTQIRPLGTARIGQAVRFAKSGDDWWFTAEDAGE